MYKRLTLTLALVICAGVLLFPLTALGNLERLISGKAALIMKAVGTDALPIERTEASLRFPWFPASASGAEADAYNRFVHTLCDMAKTQKRVTMKESAVDSEKFAFRCFLLRLGFIGAEYAPARKVLLSKLSGSGSFKSGDHKSRNARTGFTIERAGGGASVTRGDDYDGNIIPQKCSECWHHCYYTDGLLRAKSGDVIDTSKRQPDKYTQ